MKRSNAEGQEEEAKLSRLEEDKGDDRGAKRITGERESIAKNLTDSAEKRAEESNSSGAVMDIEYVNAARRIRATSAGDSYVKFEDTAQHTSCSTWQARVRMRSTTMRSQESCWTSRRSRKPRRSIWIRSESTEYTRKGRSRSAMRAQGRPSWSEMGRHKRGRQGLSREQVPVSSD